VTDEPLVPGPLYGLRTWAIVSEDGHERLAGPHKGVQWPPGDGWFAATCTSGNHRPPERDCHCGVHAWHPTRANAKRVLASRRELAGVVEARGAIELHEDGFRAEEARPHALVASRERSAKLVRRLAESYHAQVVEVSRPEDLLAWCRERGLGLDESVVAELLGPDRLHKSAERRRIARRNNWLRLAAALAISAILIVLGSQLLQDPKGPHTLYGRTGEIHVGGTPTPAH
jgi:hypothetical protein